MVARNLRIGVDVGGTNTDGVILDPLRASEQDKGIIAWHKSPTTREPSHGISNAITAMFLNSSVDAADIASVTIGTTHFVNAVVEMDMTRLTRVAVIRLCCNYSKHAPPCIDWPMHLQTSICSHYALLKGGLEIDGNLISEIDEEEIRSECATIEQKGIDTVVIAGIFSPIDTLYRQEERARDIVKSALPGCDVVLSKDVANLGFLERENAAILNAAILKFARKTIRSFQRPIKRLGLKCPVFITQNDGTVLTGRKAASLPIRTFSSGPTNSMRGAAFLVENQLREAMMVVDIGGTTTDAGMLLANGFPRQAAAFNELAGIRMNFSYPDVRSIGLGGGSIVRKERGVITVGPESVGYSLQSDALVFGGNVATATDYTVAANQIRNIGEASRLGGKLDQRHLEEYQVIVNAKLEKLIDTMKTSPEAIPVILVGGGAIIAPDTMKGASRVLKPQWSGIANAIGAAIASVSETVDVVRSTERMSIEQITQEVCADAIERTVQSGGSQETTRVVEVDTLPLQYIANKTRFIIRAAGNFDYARKIDTSIHDQDTDISEEVLPSLDDITKHHEFTIIEQTKVKDPLFGIDILRYRPRVEKRVWYISEADLNFITIGCYILGTGGGGSPYSSMLHLRSILRAGGVVKIINPRDLRDSDLVGGGGGGGSPTVGIEKLPGDEMMDAQRELHTLLHKWPTAVIALEIGGGNGLQGMIIGASTNLDVPVVDGDWMGRAYPTRWQITPVVFQAKGATILPISCSDGNGNVLHITKSRDDLTSEKIIRAALSQLGSHIACADGHVSGKNAKAWAVEHTISLSWRIGRAVMRARQNNNVDHVAEAIVSEVGGEQAAKVLFKGKIIAVERTLRTGHVYGEVIIEGTETVQGKVKIPFKNENIATFKIEDNGTETLLAVVPDLIAVIDAQNGEAIGTPEYRFGLQVIVLGITASEKWTSTPRGLDIGGPKAFGLDHLAYNPLGKFTPPLSVIDEYSD